MPNWHEICEEIENEMEQHQTAPVAAFYRVRKKYLEKLFQKTERNTIVYASNWTWSSARSDNSLTIEDIYGVMAVMSGMQGEKLDLILHTPGGNTSAAEALVCYLRAKFNDIRVVIPHAAMSAGTLIACSANKVMMGRHSFIGPTDPQVLVRHKDKIEFMPAQSILDDFQRAQEHCQQNGGELEAWQPILDQYPMGLISDCHNAIDLSRDLAQRWLESYMFKGQQDAAAKAESIAGWLSKHDNFHSHNRFIGREEARAHQLDIEDLEGEQEIQDLVLSIFHTILFQFGQYPGFPKIIENHKGVLYFPPTPRLPRS